MKQHVLPTSQPKADTLTVQHACGHEVQYPNVDSNSKIYKEMSATLPEFACSDCYNTAVEVSEFLEAI